MQARYIVSGLVVVSLLAGCSIFERKQVDYKAGAVRTEALEVPPDLTVPESEQRYTIPGTDGAKVASYSEYTRKTTEQPCVAPASAPAAAAPASAPAAALQESNGTKVIVLGEPFDRSWRKVGLALERARIVATDIDRSKGVYFIAAAAGKDKQKLPDHQVVVREVAGGSEVTVVDADGKSNTETARVVETLYQNLEK
jgi:outer membrane protein assembly factor BamC